MGQNRPSRSAAPPPPFRGSALATIDDAGRLKLPAGFRRVLLEGSGRSLYVTSLEGDRVWVYPLAAWEERERKLIGFSSQHPAVSKFLERVSYFGADTELDGQGRLMIPPRLRDSARIEGEVAILGKLAYLEVWNSQSFRDRLAASPFTADDHHALAELGL